MGKFYKTVKITFTIFYVFLGVFLIPAIVCNIIQKNWLNIALMLLFIVAFNVIAIGLLVYYRNSVIEISFQDDNTIIKTNVQTIVLPSSNFVEVNDSVSFGRIFIKYRDDEITKRFIFIKGCWPFKLYTLDFNEMRKNMKRAIFRKS